mgnify:CR=1 FL=1
MKKIAARFLGLVNRPFTKGHGSKGMTLIEIIIVVALLATLMTILLSNLSNKSDQAKVDQAKIAMGYVAQELQLYRVHNNHYPSTQEGLQALLEAPGGDASKRWRGPYIEADKLKDPWGNPFDYSSDGRTFKITSGGISGQIGGGTDITYPESSEEQGQSENNQK